jgi:phosphotriesterase-related protein
MSLAFIQAVKGWVPVEDLGLILPHEHLFTDLRGPHVRDYAVADPDIVARVMKPYLDAAHERGVTALVECSTVGVGRNVTILQRLADLTPIQIIAPTGVYRQGYIPSHWEAIDAEELAEEWIQDLNDGMNGTRVRAGFIKVAVSDEGPTTLEIRNLIAAASASRQTGAAVAVHTPNGDAFQAEINILEAEGLESHRFIWAHANLETNTALHLEAARRGVYLSFDAVGASWQDQEALIASTLAVLEAGYAANVLLSHDAGWYDPSQPDGQPEGEGIRGFTALMDEFIPALRSHGVPGELIHQMTISNPANAFAFHERVD